LSLSSLYKLKRGKTHSQNKTETETTANAEALKAELEKIAIPPEIAKHWQDNNCGKPC